MNMRYLFQWLSGEPRKIFLLDGAGALLTAGLTFILSQFGNYFGMPWQVTAVLVATAIVFALYSFTCYWAAGSNWRSLLKIIAAANCLYAIATAAFLVYFFPVVTGIGIIYFVAEISVIGLLVYAEKKLTATF